MIPAEDISEIQAVGARAFKNGVPRPTTVEELGTSAGSDLTRALAWLHGFLDAEDRETFCPLCSANLDPAGDT